MASPTTLWDYVDSLDARLTEGGAGAHGSSWDARVLIEHGVCGANLGLHGAFIDEVEPAGVVMLLRSDVQRRPYPAPLFRGGRREPVEREPSTTPRVECFDEWFGGRWYARVYCSCLPAGHVEKRRMEKLGSLAVTFPGWKWGRPIDLPVVTI